MKPVPVDKVQDFESGLIAYINREYPYILDQIEAKKALDDELEQQIKTALDAYAKEFSVTQGA